MHKLTAIIGKNIVNRTFTSPARGLASGECVCSAICIIDDVTLNQFFRRGIFLEEIGKARLFY